MQPIASEKTQLTITTGCSSEELHIRTPLSITFDGIDITLRPPTDTEIQRGFKPHVAFCSGQLRRSINNSVASALRELAAGRLPSTAQKWERLGMLDISPGSELGNWIPPRFILPAGVREAFESTTGRINGAIRELVKLVRWRSGSSRMHDPLRHVGTLNRWSLDEITWHPLPGDYDVTVIDNSLTQIDDALLANAQDLNSIAATEPIAHALWREAWSLYMSSPRSALMIGVASAEVGFKELVALLMPDAKWLVENLASPPLERMLRDFLPQLPAKNRFEGKVLPPPKETLELLKKAILERNKTTHVGDTVNRDRAKEILLMIRNLLWLFDYYGGHTWALAFVTSLPDEARRGNA